MTAINEQKADTPSESYFSRYVSIAPLVTFRIVFGLLMLVSTIRFWSKGWITSLYLTPKFHFTYMGFEWVQPLGSVGMHLVFVALIISALFIITGFLYRISVTTFFLAFTYVELLDVTTYLNHYYYVSLVSFLLIWLPAGKAYAIDTLLQPKNRRTLVPAWTIDILRFQMAVVYVFAGIAKLNHDWLIDAQPMRTWLPAKSHLPVVGGFMYEPWVAYLFSWFGAVYDLFIAFFLLYRPTRAVAYGFVLLFHIATAIFFPAIGVFPYVMVTGSLIFFSGNFHSRLLGYLPYYKGTNDALSMQAYTYKYTGVLQVAMYFYISLQILLPFRHLLYPGHLFWTEEGFRFSWRVMLMEKAGTAFFTVKEKNKIVEVNNAAFLTPLQEKMMSTQPDLILKYAHYLALRYKEMGFEKPEVYADVYVALNGERSRPFIDTTINLAAQPLSWKHYQWILPYKK